MSSSPELGGADASVADLTPAHPDVAVAHPDVAVAHLVDVHPSVSLFAEGIVGEPVRIEALEGEGRGWPWTAAIDDALVIRLPAVMAAFDTVAANRRAYRTQVLQQLSHRLLATAPNDRRNPHPLIETSAEPVLALELFSLFENWRVAAGTKRIYPGGAAGLDEAMFSALGDLPPGRPTPLQAVRLATLGSSAASMMSGADIVDGWAANLLSPRAPTDQSARAALAVLELVQQLAREGEGAADTAAVEVPLDFAMDDVVLEEETPDRDEEVDEALGAALGSTMPPVEAMMVDELDGAVAEGELPIAEKAEDRATGPKPQRRSLKIADLESDGRSFVYDEWDYRTERYRAAWCRVVEERLVGDDHEFIVQVRRSHQELRARIRRNFAQLRPQERVRMHRRTEGEDLDLDAVVEAMVDRRSGRTPDDNLHLRREPLARDVATAFLVDLSASTGSAAVEPEPIPLDEWGEFEFVEYPSRGVGSVADAPVKIDTRKVIDIAKESVALMCDALGQLGDRHAVFGFSGTGRKNVQFVVAKQFDDRTSPTTWSALGAMKPMAYTRMGPAIRHATARIASQEAQTKLLLVISDGYPQDLDYGEDRRDREYGIQDTAQALAEARSVGVDPFCVTIDPAGHDYLRTMCPNDRYLVIDDVTALPTELAKLYVSLTRPTLGRWGTGENPEP